MMLETQSLERLLNVCLNLEFVVLLLIAEKYSAQIHSVKLSLIIPAKLAINIKNTKK